MFRLPFIPNKPRPAIKRRSYSPMLESLEDRLLLADLRAILIDANDPVVAGRSITYRATVANNTGIASDALNVSLKNIIPETMTFKAMTVVPEGWTCDTPPVGERGDIVCHRASLPFGQHSTLSFVLRVNSDVPEGTVSNTVSVSGASLDTNTDNNSSTAQTTVNVESDLKVFIKNALGSVPPGKNQTTRLTAWNPGPSAVQDVRMLYSLPAFTSFVAVTVRPVNWVCNTPPSGWHRTVDCSTTSLAPGWQTISVVARVNPEAANQPTTVDVLGTVTGFATTTTPFLHSNASASTHVKGTFSEQNRADLRIEMQKLEGQTKKGYPIFYKLTVTNAGPVPAIAAQVMFKAPRDAASGAYQGFTTDMWSCRNEYQEVVCVRKAPLGPGESDEELSAMQYDAVAAPASVLTALAAVSSGTRDPSTSPSNNSATHSIVVTAND